MSFLSGSPDAHSLHWALDQNLPPSPQYWFDFAETVNNQGFDWASFYTSDHFPKSACLGSCQSLATHGVNNGQALKSGAVWWRQNRSCVTLKHTTHSHARTHAHTPQTHTNEHDTAGTGTHPKQKIAIRYVAYTPFSIASEPVFRTHTHPSHSSLQAG